MTPQKRSQLRARAHALDPVVILGQSGLSAAVLAEVERALKSHELIKIRATGAERDERESILEQVCRATGAEPVQHIGKILVVYRENPGPRAASEARPRPRRKAAPRRATRSARR